MPLGLSQGSGPSCSVDQRLSSDNVSGSPQSGFYPSENPDNSDSASLASSVSSVSSSVSGTIPKQFVVPSTWRPSIMSCISASSEEEMCQLLTMSIRNEIVRDLVTQMYAIKTKPDRALCTSVAKSLVKKYPLLKDSGKNVSGFVSTSSIPQ